VDASSTVGGLSLPLAAGTANGGIADPTIAALLSFGGFLIKWALDARLAQQQGPAQSGEPVTDACPVDQRYPFNPETTHVRLPKPALFAWWDGASVVEQWTSIYGVRKRSIKMLYLSQEVVIPGGIAARHGVPAVVDAWIAARSSTVSRRTINRDIRALRVALRWAAERGLCAPVPALRRELREPSRSEPRDLPTGM
jgi:hypothetical protein